MARFHFMVRSRTGERVRFLGRSFMAEEQIVDGDELTPENLALLRAAAADPAHYLEVREVPATTPYVKGRATEGKD